MARRARRGAAAVHGGRRLGEPADLGHGDREPGPDRRRPTGGLPDEPGRQQAPDAGRRADPAGLPRHRPAATASTATQPSRGGDALPSTAWHPEFEDVNNDGLIDLFVSKGNVDAMPDYAIRDPSNLFLGQPDGTFVEGAEAGGHRLVRQRSRRRARRLQPGRPARPGPGQPRRAGARLAQRRRRNGRGAGADGQLARAPAAASPAATATRSARSIETKAGEAGAATRATSSAAATSAASWAGRMSGLGPATEAQVRVTWPDGEVGPVDDVAANQFLDIDARLDSRRPRGRRPTAEGGSDDDNGAADDGRPARLRHARGASRGPRRPLRRAPGRAARARRGRGARPARRVRGPRAQREPGVPDRLRPALRGGDAGRGAGRRPADPGGQRVLRDGRRRAAADAPRAVPGLQPAQPAARPVAAAARHPGGGGDRRRARGSGVLGWKSYADPARIEIPAFIVDELRAPRGRHGLGQQRERAPHRPRRRAAGDQRRGPARRVRARVVPDVRRASAGCSRASSPG